MLLVFNALLVIAAAIAGLAAIVLAVKGDYDGAIIWAITAAFNWTIFAL